MPVGWLSIEVGTDMAVVSYLRKGKLVRRV